MDCPNCGKGPIVASLGNDQLCPFCGQSVEPANESTRRGEYATDEQVTEVLSRRRKTIAGTLEYLRDK